MMTALILAGGMIFGQAAAEPNTELAGRVERLVDQLDASNLTQREAAEQALVELGPEALDLLPGPDDRVPAETKIRLGRIRQKLQQKLAEQTIQPSVVTLEGSMTFSEALAAIEEQSGNKIAAPGFGGPQAPLTVDFQKTPFWQALDTLLDRANLDVYPYGAQEGLPLQPRSPGRRPRSEAAACAGPFRIEPVAVEARRDLRNPSVRSLRLNLEVTWEPRLKPVSLGHALADVKAVDAEGNPLPLADIEADPTVPVSTGQMAAEISVPFAPPPRSLDKIAKLSGKLAATVPGRIAKFRFKDLAEARNVEKRVAAAKVVLVGTRKNRDVWEVVIGVRFDQAAGSLDSYYNWVYDNPAYLEDPDGKQVEYAAIQGTRRREDEVGMAYLFSIDRPLDEYTFVYETPAMILSNEFEYELEDIPLP